MTLFSLMDITVAINSNCEIEINITIHTLALLIMCQNSYYQIVTLITPFGSSIATMFVVSCILFVEVSIIAANTSIVLQLYPCCHLNAYYNYTYTNINFIVVLILILTVETTTD